MIQKLIREAIKIRENAYAPYSNFQVGACVLGRSGKMYVGCNIENSSYGATICAERTAISQAVAQGETSIQKIAIVGGSRGGSLEHCPPCGICRQVMREFSDPKTFEIILATSEEKYEIRTLEQLLPDSFGPDNLKME